MKIDKRHYICALAFIPAVKVFAIESPNDITFELRASTKLSDNGLRQPVDPIEERQDELGASFTAGYANEWMNLTTSYDASRYSFEHESQESRNLLQGETALTFGNAYQPLSLMIAHSRRSLLNKPDAIDLIGNRDERDIASIRPAARWKLNESDALTLAVDFSKVSYKFEGSKDSKLQGVNVAWQLGLSKTDTLVFSAQENSISFDGASEFDYKLQNLSVKYAVELNRLSYSVSLGGNRVVNDSNTDNFTEPALDLSVKYESGYNTFGAIANKTITNTSMGDANNPGLGVSPGDSLGEGIDLVDLSRAEVSWSTSAVCERCQVNVNAFGLRQKYQNKTTQSYTEKGVGAGFNYNLTRAASIYINGSHSDRSFEPGSLRSDFTMKRASVGLAYKFQNDLQFKIYRFQEKRDTVVFAETYVEHYTGISLSYSF